MTSYRQFLANTSRRKKWLARSLAATLFVAVPAGSALAISNAGIGGADNNTNSQVKTTDKTSELKLEAKNHSQSSPGSPGGNSSLTADSSLDSSSTSSTSVSQHTHVSSSPNGHSTAKVSVNGKNIAIPKNGTVHKTIKSTSGGQTQIDVDNNQEGSSSNSSNFSLNVHISNNSSKRD